MHAVCNYIKLLQTHNTVVISAEGWVLNYMFSGRIDC